MRDEEQGEITNLLEELMHRPRYPFPAPRGRLVPTEEAARELDRKGVYIIYSPRGEVEHVGSTPRAQGGLAQRLRDHLHGNSSYTYMEHKGKGSTLSEGYTFQCLAVDDGRQRALVEALGIGRLCPRHIGHGLDSSEPDAM